MRIWITLGCLAITAGCDAGQASDPSPLEGTGGDTDAAAGAGGSAGTSGSAGAGGSAGTNGSAGVGGGGSAGVGGSGGGTPDAGGDGGVTYRYTVQGNKILRDGVEHRFVGISRPSLEWNPQGEDLYERDYQNIAAWGANVVRLPLNQVSWRNWAPYPRTIDTQIQWAHKYGMDVILDLHWSEGPGGEPKQQRMADASSRTFWQSVAERYKNDGGVLFELYNEPHDVSWDVWKNGGNSGDGFTVVGMQQLYQTVRDTGATNLVIIGGLDHAYDLKGIRTHRITGNNIVYATHPYDFSNKQPGNWEADWGFLAATDPVMVTEFGRTSGDCGTGYYSSLLDYADQKRVHWVAWAWYVSGCAFPSLITNYDGTPSQAGSIVRQRMQSY
jgi:endoglucanase